MKMAQGFCTLHERETMRQKRVYPTTAIPLPPAGPWSPRHVSIAICKWVSVVWRPCINLVVSHPFD